MNQQLTKNEAIEFLGVDQKLFDNFFKNANEFPCIPRNNGRGRFYFDKSDLQKWLDGYNWRTIELTLEDYTLCLDFALAQHFRGYVLSDWGTARQREFGQKITNWVKGQLGEVAVKKFIKREYGLDVELDFSIYDEIVPQDIIGVLEDGKSRDPKVGIGIKSSKPKSSYLVLGENEIIIPERRSDYYILCRPDIPDDHLLRITSDRVRDLVSGQQHYEVYKDKIPNFEKIKCEIAGWCSIGDLEEVTSIPGVEFSGKRFVIQSGKLKKDKQEWDKLVNLL